MPSRFNLSYDFPLERSIEEPIHHQFVALFSFFSLQDHLVGKVTFVFENLERDWSKFRQCTTPAVELHYPTRLLFCRLRA